MNKSFQLAIIIGRFQGLHLSHQELIDKALELSETAGVLVGSSQEEGTEKNPFSYELRRGLLKKVYGDRILVFPLPDAGIGNNPGWGEYVLSKAESYFGRLPDLIVSGKEERRNTWFESKRGSGIAELVIPKKVDISATRMRRYLLDGNESAWREYTDRRLWPEYQTLRELVRKAQGREKTNSI